jgi:hypothetical protein
MYGGKVKVCGHASLPFQRSDWNWATEEGAIDQWFPKWAVLLSGGALEVGLSNRVDHLFTTEMTLDQTLGNWCHVIKPIHHIKDLLTVQ